MNLTKLLQKFKRPYLFTTPSHSGAGFGDFAKFVGHKVFGFDFSEIDGFDNIRNPQGVLKSSQEKAAEIYDAKASFYLYNGSTSGILALMLSVLDEKDKVLIPRNCHISVLNGLILSRAEGVFLEPKYDSDFDVPKPISPALIESILYENPDIKALILTSPTYEGVVSDLTTIATICKAHNVILIVDEAHGALWNFSGKLPTPAIQLGADASVQSLHKTAGALTQSSILHIAKGSKISRRKIQKSLNLINSTSPSYLLLASIESAIAFLASKKGAMELDKTLKNILITREKLSKIQGVKLLDNGDFTKIFVKVEGLSGYKLSEKLAEYNIEDELANDKGVLLLCGLGTSKEKLDKLYKAVKKIATI
jgi:arginine/lysine/ornithine decarboxylase